MVLLVWKTGRHWVSTEFMAPASVVPFVWVTPAFNIDRIKWTHAPRNSIEWVTEMSQKQNMGFQQWFWTKMTLTGKYDFGHLTKKLVERRSYIIHHVDMWPLHFKFPARNVPIKWIVKSSYESNYSCLVKLCHKCGLQECNHGPMTKWLYNIFQLPRCYIHL